MQIPEAMEESSPTPKIGKDDVIAKLKDDGDFDNLRLKIIRKLKDNEELRNEIISIVQQSAALNRAGAENMKPRQISDAIYDEVGNKVMSQISDGLWQIIRSGDGMKSEITETVQSVYNKLVNPKGKEGGESTHDMMPIQMKAENNGSGAASACEVDGMFSDSEPKEPPGFSLLNTHQNNDLEEKHKKKLQPPMPHERELVEQEEEDTPYSRDALKPEDVDLHAPPGFSADMEQQKLPCDGSDEDPDVPPGFG